MPALIPTWSERDDYIDRLVAPAVGEHLGFGRATHSLHCTLRASAWKGSWKTTTPLAKSHGEGHLPAPAISYDARPPVCSLP
jgi:hypothetical protein